MKKGIQVLFLILSITLFIFFRTHSSDCINSFIQKKPFIPLPIVSTSASSLVERIVLGETSLGLPFYLEIRQYDLKEIVTHELVTWHLNLLDGPCETVLHSEQRSVYIRRGNRNPARSDTTHGFAALQGERALFLHAYEKNGFFYICTAEGPLETFLEHESFLRSLCVR